MSSDIKFCSECKWAKEFVMDDGIYIKCQKQMPPNNVKAAMWVKSCTPFRKLNAYACVSFEQKK